MRLTGIKLAGFKTFVDPTKVSFLGNRSAVVGPNGCGKSNIVDAVRWVIGESSARRLRGESSTDVIFSGSSARQATAMASVELSFDNSDGRVGGQYARFGEIAIRREVTRTGQSSYFLNGTRCRRRDIVDVFLGTGFGPRSYSIIEQGMISELVAAKPDDLRVYLEEAAGISKYRERRRETESRMRVTRENLERLHDIRSELADRLARLQKQARAAERYRGLKAEQRRRTAELLLLRVRAVDAELAASDAAIGRLDTAYQKAMSKIRSLDRELEEARMLQQERAQALGDIQGHAYRIEADIGRTEEAMRLHRTRVEELRADLEDAERRAAAAAEQLVADEREIAALQASVAEQAPELERARVADTGSAGESAAAEEQMAAWQTDWERFSAQAASSERELTVETSRAEHCEASLAELRTRLGDLASEAGAPANGMPADARDLDSAVEQAEGVRDRCEARMKTCLQALSELRTELAAGESAVDAARHETQRLRSEIAALTAVQDAALGSEPGAARDWIAAHGLADAPRLGQGLAVEPGWESAAEVVLAHHLQAVRVGDTGGLAAELDCLEGGNVALYEGGDTPMQERDLPALATLVRVQGGPVGSLLAGVYAADSVDRALASRPALAAGESIVTRDGVWMGVDWIRHDRGDDLSDGVVRRAADLETLGSELGDAERRLAAADEALAQGKLQAQELETDRDRFQEEYRQSGDRLAQLRGERDVRQVRIDEARARQDRIERQRGETESLLAEESERLNALHTRIERLSGKAGEVRSKRRELTAERDRLTERVEAARAHAAERRDLVHTLDLEYQRRTSALDAARTARERLLGQRGDLLARVDGLRENIEESLRPLPELQRTLDEKLGERLALTKRQAQSRRALEQVESEVANLSGKRHEAGEAVEAARDRVQEAQLQREGASARRNGLAEQLRDTGFTAEELAATLPEDAAEADWVASLEAIERRIARLGAINLAAIEEFEEESERKQYLDAQNEDLEQALATLQSAIGRIDTVTRTRFKHTFDEVNVHLATLFPKVFGGGKAYLQLTGENLLDTGVRFMARPPGKSNSNVQMLSGGEKALAAVALVFAIFQLNPSPVCLLDEVDAPLDDANVARFAELLHEMSKDVQFVVITHNKLTMELADHLLGVTMSEPGVSRLVSVDMEEAASMAAV